MSPPSGDDRPEPAAEQYHERTSTPDAESTPDVEEGGQEEALDDGRGQPQDPDEERRRFEEFKREVFGPRCC